MIDLLSRIPEVGPEKAKTKATKPTISYCKTLTYNGNSQVLTNTAGTGYAFYDNSGVYPNGQQLRWETLEEVRKRMQRVAEKYAGYEKVIFVGHSMAFEALTGIEHMEPAEIIEWEYLKN